MIISYAGGYCFKLSSGDTTVAINPPSQKSAFKVSKFGADIALISMADQDWDGAETATHGDKEPFVIRGPGAYEVGSVVVNGYASDDHRNTIYALEFDGMHVLILGALKGKIPQEVRADLNDVNILMVPVGADTLDPKDAHEITVSLEPNLIIPYQVGKGDDLKAFLKAEGATGIKATDKLTLRAKEVAALDGEVAIFG